MVGNVNLLQYLASSLQPSSRGPCLNTSTSTSSKTTQSFFSRDAKWEEEFGVITCLEEKIGVIYGVVAHETCRWRDFVFLMSGIPVLGFKTEKQVKEAAAALQKGCFSAEEMRQIQKIVSG